MTCRARKVRCDEVKPTCANCTRLNLHCDYKNLVSGLVARRSNRRGPILLPDRPDTTFFQTVLRPDGQRQFMAAASQTPPSQQSPARVGDALSPETSVGPQDVLDTADFASFDMLGFIGDITSDIEQKHLDLTSAGTPALGDHISGDFHTERQMAWHADVPSLGDARGASTEELAQDTGSGGPGTQAMDEEQQLLMHFSESGPPPAIFGPMNLEWNFVKEAVVTQSPDCLALEKAMYCYADVERSLNAGQRGERAPLYHQQAGSEIQSCLEGEIDDALLKRVFAAVLLLMLSEVLSSTELWRTSTSFLHSAYQLLQRFHQRTRTWVGLGHLVVSWVALLDVKSLVAGRDGDPLTDLGEVTQPPDDMDNDDILLHNAGYLVHEALVGPAFGFFLQTQQVIRRIVCIDLHHRSRGTVDDEFEVLQIAHRVGADLETQWQRRPRVVDLYDHPERVEGSLQPAVADELCRTFRQYVANFLAIFIYLHRVAFVIYPRTDRVHRAVDQIIQLAALESTTGARHLPASFIWPLFVAGLEGSPAQRGWIVAAMWRMEGLPAGQKHPNIGKARQLLEEMTRRQDLSRTWADSRCVRQELFTESFVMI